MEIQTLRIFTGEELKTCLYNQTVQGSNTDVKIVCCDGVVNVHRVHLCLYLPELLAWIPAEFSSFDSVIYLADYLQEEVQIAVEQMYIEDSPELLRSLLGLPVDNAQFTLQIVPQTDHVEFEYTEEALVEMPDPLVDSKQEDQGNDDIDDDDHVDDSPIDPQSIFQHDESTLKERMKYDKLFPCPACSKVFTSPHYMKTHELKAHDNSVLVSRHRCLAHIDLVFENINRIIVHFNEEHNQRLIRDLVNRGQVPSRKARRRKPDVDLIVETNLLLNQSPSKNKDFVCSMCSNFSSDKEESLNNHIDLCHTPIQCPDCDKQITSKRNLKSHMTYVHKIKGMEHVCQECGKDFTTLQSLQKHQDSKHALEKKFKCEECPKSYGTRSMLKDHVDSKHRDAQYPCSTCGKVFGSKSLLRGHEHTHTDVRKFGCQECDKRFRTREKLKNHQSVHTRIKHPCGICGSQFSRAETLKTHMKLHDESKALKCGECGKLFDTSQKLKEHTNTHTGVKPFMCAACSASFSSSSSLCHHKKNCSYLQKLESVESSVRATVQAAVQNTMQHTQNLKTELFYM